MQDTIPYRVIGTVKQFGEIIGKVDGVTYAVSPAKARNNMLYRFKRERGFTADCKMTINAVAEQIY